MRVIVDGDNVLRALGLVSRDYSAGAEAFLQDLESAAAALDWEVIVVFDGPERFLRRETGLLVVRYAKGKTADTLIERLVYEAEDRLQIAVVTRDRAEGDLVAGLGARVWTPERLVQEMKAA